MKPDDVRARRGAVMVTEAEPQPNATHRDRDDHDASDAPVPLQALAKAIEELASRVICADATDAPELLAILRTVGEPPPMAEAAWRDCIVLLERIISGAEEDVDATLERVASTVGELQLALEGGFEASIQPTATESLELPEWVDEVIFDEFLSLQQTSLEELEADILQLEAKGKAGLDPLRRRLHTLKGEAGALGLYDLESVCHGIEDLLLAERDGPLLVDLLLEAKDWIAAAVEGYSRRRRPSPAGAALVAQLKGAGGAEEPLPSDGNAVASAAEDRDPPRESAPAAPDTSPTTESLPGSTQRLSPVPEPEERDPDTVELFGEFLDESDEGLATVDQLLLDLEEGGHSADSVDALFRVYHTIKGVAGFLELEQITSLAHTTETLLNLSREGKRELSGGTLDLIFDATASMRAQVRGVRRSVESSMAIGPVDGTEGIIQKLKSAIEGAPPEEVPLPPVQRDSMLGEVLVTTGAATEEIVEAALARQRQTGRRLGEELVTSGALRAKDVAHGLRAQKAARDGGTPTKIKETVKVDLERVDSLVEMIGELVIVESMVAARPEIASIATPEVRKNLSQLAKISGDLQWASMQLRMIPVRGVFQKMARMVRDLSHKSGKRIKLLQSGQATEMDRSMVEQIGDPLVHMIRNAVDHGVEPPEQRVAAGKPAEGTVRLSAYHEGGSIVIQISDDGRGLDRDAIVGKALAQGLIKSDEGMSENEIFNLIFSAGFSTAKEVTQISGRGVGMDVVRRNIESMRGRVAISSAKGKGSTFKIILPLTLAIIDGMLVACGAERYIIPTLSIVESTRPTAPMLSSFAGRGELIDIRGESIPLLRLDRAMGIPGAQQEATEAIVVVIESSEQRFGLLIDDVLNQQQVVIKSLGRSFANERFLAGGTILSDGTVGLILSVDEIGALQSLASEEEKHNQRPRQKSLHAPPFEGGASAPSGAGQPNEAQSATQR